MSWHQDRGESAVKRDERILELRDSYGLSFNVIAKRLGLSPEWVNERYHKLKNKEKFSSERSTGLLNSKRR